MMIQGDGYENGDEELDLRDMKEAKIVGCKDWMQMMRERE